MSACYAVSDFYFVGFQTLQEKCIDVFVLATVIATVITAAAATTTIATASTQQHLLSTRPKPWMGHHRGVQKAVGCVCGGGYPLQIACISPSVTPQEVMGELEVDPDEVMRTGRLNQRSHFEGCGCGFIHWHRPIPQ